MKLKPASAPCLTPIMLIPQEFQFYDSGSMTVQALKTKVNDVLSEGTIGSSVPYFYSRIFLVKKL